MWISANEPRITLIWIRIHPRNLWLKITAAFRVSTIAIEFDRVAGAFTRCATVFATVLRGAGTRWVFTLVLVGHEILLKIAIIWSA